MNKGTRVRITGGRSGKGQSGTIFWKGPNKFGPGDRFGVTGDDGSTYWVLEDDVEEAGDAPPVPESSVTYDKGDRVQLSQQGETILGSVFWTGQSKVGGQRLGVKREDNPDAEAIWIDARFCEPVSGDAPPPPARSANTGGSQGGWQSNDDDGDEMPADYATPMSVDEMPPMAPMDDGDIDRFAAEVEEED